MKKTEMSALFASFETKRERTIVIVDYGNVNKWTETLGWNVGIRELARLIKNFSYGQKFLRRFYYGSDYGKSEKSMSLLTHPSNTSL